MIQRCELKVEDYSDTEYWYLASEFEYLPVITITMGSDGKPGHANQKFWRKMASMDELFVWVVWEHLKDGLGRPRRSRVPLFRVSVSDWHWDKNTGQRLQGAFADVGLRAISKVMRKSEKALARVLDKASDPTEMDKEASIMIMAMQKVRTAEYCKAHPTIENVTYEELLAWFMPKVKACPLTRAIWMWEVAMTARFSLHSAAQHGAVSKKHALLRVLNFLPGVTNCTLYLKLWAFADLHQQAESPVYLNHYRLYVQHVMTKWMSGHYQVGDLYHEKIIQCARRVLGRLDSNDTVNKALLAAKHGYHGKLLKHDEEPVIPDPLPDNFEATASTRRTVTDVTLADAHESMIRQSNVFAPVGTDLLLGEHDADADDLTSYRDVTYVTLEQWQLSSIFVAELAKQGRKVYNARCAEEIALGAACSAANPAAAAAQVPKTVAYKLRSTASKARASAMMLHDRNFCSNPVILYAAHMDGEEYKTGLPSKFGGKQMVMGMGEARAQIELVRKALQERRDEAEADDVIDEEITANELARIVAALNEIPAKSEIQARKAKEEKNSVNGRQWACNVLGAARTVEQSFWHDVPERPELLEAAGFPIQAAPLTADELPDFIRAFDAAWRTANGLDVGTVTQLCVNKVWAAQQQQQRQQQQLLEPEHQPAGDEAMVLM